MQSAEQVFTNPVKLTWRKGTPAPMKMTSYGAAVVHGNTAYFSEGPNVYSYTQDKWTELQQSKYEDFSMAIIKKQLTTIGGQRGGTATNTLFCLSTSSSGAIWEDLLPLMPTARLYSAAVTTPTHLIVAGGKIRGEINTGLSVVEALDTNTLQWSSVCSSPITMEYPNVTLCNGQIYLSEHNKIFSCSVEELLKFRKSASTNSSDGGSVWTKLANIPVPHWASLTTLRGQVFAIGGQNNLMWDKEPTRAIFCYDRSTNSWSAIRDKMKEQRIHPLVAVIPSHELIVVGGHGCNNTEVA